MFGISFLSPLFLVAAIAAAVPILLHLFHRKTEVVIDFPAVRLLTRAPVQQHRRRRLRELLLLALRVGALVLLALSFARPYFAGAVAPDSAPLTVIAIDTSLSMSAPGQIDRVREAAVQAANDAPSAHALALMTFNDAPTVAVEPTTDRTAIHAAIGQAVPAARGTRFRTALARATELMGTRDGRVVLITDLQQAGWEANDEGGLPDGVEVEVRTIAPPAGNLALTSAERRDGRVIATVQNYGSSEVKTSARVMLAGKPVTQAAVTIAPLAAADVVLNASLPRTGDARVEIDDADGYQLDNARSLELDSQTATPVAVVVADPTGSSGGLYVERALNVAGGGREFRVDVMDGAALSKWAQDDLNRRAVLFVLGTRTLDRAGRELIKTYLSQGGHVFLTLGPETDVGTLNTLLGVSLAIAEAPIRTPGATMIATDGRHPIFRPFLNPAGALGDVQVDQYRRLNDQADATVLARFSGGDAALTEQAVGEGRLMIYTSDLDNEWSRFPLNPAFVPFAVEATRYLARDAAGGEDAPVVELRESNPASTTVEEFTSAIDRINRASLRESKNAAREVENQQRWWQVGLLVMLAALAGEALMGRRAT
jgi:Aerotolerance regulator N-terminal/von Willebrand factor type A domain